jgi:branched-chain amino acid transport system ATP-binding protein
MSEPIFSLQGVVAGFGRQTVLHGVDLDVRQGEVAAVFGLNGAGKSVTMKVAAGLVPARRGAVRLGGRDITGLPPEDRVSLGVANVPQGRQVFAGLTVEQNLRLGALPLRRRDRRRYAAALEGVLTAFPVLREKMHAAAGTLSGGQQASLAVARALMSEPQVMLVDEPTAGLAPSIVEELLVTLRAVNRGGVTILLVEQNVGFGLRLADTVHVMQRGRIVHRGETAGVDRQRLAELLGVGRLLGRSIAGADTARDRTRPVLGPQPAQ